jgi:hypothetical protein
MAKSEVGFQGSRNINCGSVGPFQVVLASISPEARDLLDRIMDEWENHLVELKATHGEGYEPGYYGFAYWLVRWSGLVRPNEMNGDDT